MLEVIPDVEGGKDVALRALIGHLKPRALLVLGDDLTDVGMFEVARAFQSGEHAATVLGISGGAETPPAIAQLADELLPSTAAAGEALALLADALGASAG